MNRSRTALRHQQRGIALLMVLWVLILLGLIAASFLRETRLGINLARNITENAKAEALAEAGIRRAMVGLLDPDPATRWRIGTAYNFALGDGTVVVRMEDEGGKVDLNHAPAPILRALLEAAGADPEMARTVADAIRDYRDADQERRAAGAEDPEYLAAGLKSGAKDAPFDDTEELMQVLGMTREMHHVISPYITVHSRRGRINLLTAPEFVLRATSNLKPKQLERILADRAGAARLDRVRADVVTVRAEAVTRGGGGFTREAVLRQTGEPQQPFTIVDWRQAWRLPPDLRKAGAAER